MKISNSIGWCDETTNAVTGCDKVSPGCKNCYAATGTRARVLRAQGIETWGPKGVRHPVAQFAAKIRRLNKLCVCDVCKTANRWLGEDGRLNDYQCPACSSMNSLRRIRLFADSNSDWLDRKWAVETRAMALKEIHDAPNVDVLLLTKRIEDWEELIFESAMHWLAAHSPVEATAIRFWLDAWRAGSPPHNVWLGVSVENQAMADLRIPQLLEVPAAVRFLSCEPLLEGVRLGSVSPEGSTAEMGRRGSDRPTVDWVIVGGESGKDRRDCGVEAIVSVAEQCVAAGVACYVKQDCAFKSGEQGRIPAAIWKLKQFPVLTAKT